MKNSPKNGSPVIPTAASSTRRASGGEASPSPVSAKEADPEVLERPRRRRFTAEYKQRVLREYEAAKASGVSGAAGALLRREGSYSSHIASWQKQRDAGELAGLTPSKRGRKPKRRDPVTIENVRLHRENARLAEELRKANVIIDVQKNLSRAAPHLLDEKLGRATTGAGLGRSGRKLFGDFVPVKKPGPGSAADLALVTLQRSRLGKCSRCALPPPGPPFGGDMASKKKKKGSRAAAALVPLNRRAAGVDISAAFHVVAVPVDLDEEPVRSFRSFTGDLNRLADWLVELGITTVAMESTSIYWIPLFEITTSA